MSSLLDRRLVFVTGKGGVGKTTVASVLGLLSARHGRRTLVAELAAQDEVARTFGRAVEQFREIELADGLFQISIDTRPALAEYLRAKAGPMGGLLSNSRIFNTFAMATPGAREFLAIGKVWELAQPRRRSHGARPYDTVIVDAPATGHGLGFLRTPRTFAEVTRVGPVAHQGREITATIADRAFTGFVAVATPEEMPVNETLALSSALADDGLSLDAVVVNGRLPERFDATEVDRLRTAALNGAPPDARMAIGAALLEHRRFVSQSAQSARLGDGLAGAAVLTLPYLYTESLGRPELERLADVLGQSL